MAEEGYSAELLPAEQLFQALQSLINMVKIYEANNQLVLNNIQQLTQSAKVLLAINEVLVVYLENGLFFVNDEKLLRRKGVATVLDNLYSYLSDRHIPGFKIMPAIIEAPAGELAAFAKFLNICANHDEPAKWLNLNLQQNNIGWITIIQIDENSQNEKELQADDREDPTRRHTCKIYAYTVRALRDAAEKIAEKQRFGMRKASRMIQTMVEDICSPTSRLMVLSTIRDYDDQIFFHSVNVAILAMSLGRELGLTKEALESVGTGALFHDLGKLAIPSELLTRTGEMAEDEFTVLQQHSLDSVRMILQFMVAPLPRKSAAMLPAFSHHLKTDLSGYPSLDWRKPQSLSARIIAVADSYDALTSARVYRRKPMSGDRALGLMRVGAGTAFDPLVLKTFIRMLGVYPIGTILELEGGGVAIASAPAPPDDLTRPRARMLLANNMGGFSCGDEIDFREKDAAGAYRHRIIGSSHPATRNVQPATLLL